MTTKSEVRKAMLETAKIMAEKSGRMAGGHDLAVMSYAAELGKAAAALFTAASLPPAKRQTKQEKRG